MRSNSLCRVSATRRRQRCSARHRVRSRWSEGCARDRARPRRHTTARRTVLLHARCSSDLNVLRPEVTRTGPRLYARPVKWCARIVDNAQTANVCSESVRERRWPAAAPATVATMWTLLLQLLALLPLGGGATFSPNKELLECARFVHIFPT